jgi:hypothetical protein
VSTEGDIVLSRSVDEDGPRSYSPTLVELLTQRFADIIALRPIAQSIKFGKMTRIESLELAHEVGVDDLDVSPEDEILRIDFDRGLVEAAGRRQAQ